MAVNNPALFNSFLMGGFECSSHRRFDGRRLDLIEATRHEEFADSDYRRLADIGMKTARDGIRWHLVEKYCGTYDFTSVVSQLQAAENWGVQVIWDLFHFGLPDHLNIFDTNFPKRFASYAAAFVDFHLCETGRAPIITPANEISFFSWIAGDIGRFHPFAVNRGYEIKAQMVKAVIAGIETIKEYCPDSRIVTTEPAVNVIARPTVESLADEVERHQLSQYEVFDMIAGLQAPEFGGRSEYLDVIGVNYYPHNQWFYPDREMIPHAHDQYRPLRNILLEIYARYDRPMFISETGTEEEERTPWFRYVVEECSAAQELGVDLHGICLYPILNHPGWEDERHCRNGLWDYCNDAGERPIFEPLADALGVGSGERFSINDPCR